MAEKLEIQPLDTLEQLLTFEDKPLAFVEHLCEVKRGGPQAPRTVFCHDMMGGYLEDRFIHGCTDPNSYRFHHWQILDTFVYYSHHLVTIPPACWISAGHLHGVKVLGTLNAEFLTGVKFFDKIRGSKIEQLVASQLARVAALQRFDGWLVSVACKLDKSCVPFLKNFLRLVTEETHRAVPGSLVIWYDSVTRNGEHTPQNELNGKNVAFFDQCDGIFLHYDWNEEMLQRTARYARDRKSDVYVGIDVFARGTDYAGGFETSVAVEQVRRYGLSAGIFAAGWVYETQDKNAFVVNQCRLWNFPDRLVNEWRIVKLPLKTSFCQGFGQKFHKAGQVASNIPWYNLARQNLQPRDQGTELCGGGGSATVCTTTAYDGGGCLHLQLKPTDVEARPYFRLFCCELPLGALSLTYVFQPSCVDSIEYNLCIVLTVRSAEGVKEEIRLGIYTTTPDEQKYSIMRDYEYNPFSGKNMTGFYWSARRYIVQDLSADAILEEIGAAFETCTTNSCMLGELVVERVGDARGNVDEDSDEGVEISSDDEEPTAKRMCV